MDASIKVKAISVVNTGGADTIFFDTYLPNPIWPFQGNAL